MGIKIGINGFGRIGRPVFRRLLDNQSQIEVKAINDLTDSQTLAHLLKYDSVYGHYEKKVEAKEGRLIVDGQEFPVFAEKDPARLPWQSLGIDLVLECTGFFTDYSGAKKHLQAGAKRVIISAPSKSPEVPHYVLGVNQESFDPAKDKIISMASCTTNCLAPVAKVIDEKLGIEAGLMTTLHSYTNDQRLLDAPHRDLRRARSAALSMVPTTTGAALAVTKTLPGLKGKIHGCAVRVPTPVVSLVDFKAWVKKETEAEEVNQIFEEAAQSKDLKGILGVSQEPLVSIDLKGNSFSAVVDLPSTLVQGKKLVQVLAWYDNEWGYACRLAELAQFVGNHN